MIAALHPREGVKEVEQEASADALLEALSPLLERVRTSDSAKKDNGKMIWTDEPINQQTMRLHLTGGSARGACPIKNGESTTMVAVLDLDSHKGEVSWREMIRVAAEVAMTLEWNGISTTAFRSSGGKGIHLIMLWDKPQDAYSVRQELISTIESIGYKSGDGGIMKRQIEVFPKQDHVPVGGRGNQFILPLTGESVPLDLQAAKVLPKAAAVGMKWPMSAPVHVLQKPEREPITAERSTQHDVLRSALAAIPNAGDEELDYSTWRNILFGIHYETYGSAEGLEMAHEFSAKAGKYDPEFLEQKVWRYIKDSKETPVTGRTILSLARTYGWMNPDIFDAEAELVCGKSHEFKLLTDSDLEALPPLRWLVKSVLPDSGIGAIFGPSSSGKSFLVLDLLASVAEGLEWFGCKVSAAPCLYVGLEGQAGIARRVKAHRLMRGRGADRMRYLLTPLDIRSPRDRTALIEAIKAAGWVGGVLCVDTLNRAAPGIDENSSKDMGEVISAAKALQSELGGLVLFVHHVGKDPTKGLRGHSSLLAALDCAIEVTRDGGRRTWKVSKSKDGEDGDCHQFTLQVVEVGEDEDGDPITSCAIQPEVDPGTKVKSIKLPTGGNQKIVWDALGELFETTGVFTSDEEPDELPPGRLCLRLEDAIQKVRDRLPVDNDRKTERTRQAITGLINRGLLTLRGDWIWRH